MLSPSSPVSRISGIGPKRAAALEESGITTVGRLLEWLPRRYLDRSAPSCIRDLEVGAVATVIGEVVRVSKPRGRRGRLVVLIRDKTGLLSCTWFGAAHFMAKRFVVGGNLMITGKVSFYRGMQMVHPDIEPLDESGPVGPAILPIYPTPVAWGKAHFDSKLFRKWVADALSQTNFGRGLLPKAVAEAIHFGNLTDLFKQIHFPESLDQGRRASQLLQFQELFLLSYALLRRKQVNTASGTEIPRSSRLKPSLLQKLQFKLTSGQERVLSEIEDDTHSPRRMFRLLQGDVGSGKTVVALLAALHYIESGRQVAVMAPTEILARQHYHTFSGMLGQFDVACVLLTGSQSRKEQDQARLALESGAPLAVGTHALLSESTAFRNLGLTIVDEQHRFGVEQRMSLGKKGDKPDMLVMSATPIPRTIALVMYGDLDISVLDEKPPGRKEVKTRIVPQSRKADLMAYLREQALGGHRIYYIVPRVDESEDEEIASITETAQELAKGMFSGISVGVLHGRMKGQQKEEALSAFREGRSPVLVSTSVVEVGMDVKEADLMVIAHPERFGLSQLHQLRGRVGRGDAESYCFLLPSPAAAPDIIDKLNEFCGTGDGFKIAELDLQLRGPGDMIGYRQSGFVTANRATPFLQARLFVEARAWAERITKCELPITNEELGVLDAAALKLLSQTKEHSNTA